MIQRIHSRALACIGSIRNASRAFFSSVARAHRAHPKLFLIWCFALPAALMLFVHAVYGVYPFARNSVLVLDLNGQYVYFFEALRRAVYGDASLLYSFSRNLGGEFVGIYAYYLASPLSYVVCLFPKSMILEALYVMFVLKCGLTGLTFAIFLFKTTKLSPLTALLFSTAYALNGYAMIMQHNTMWIDCMILLPLICLGVHALIRHRRYKLYTLSLALAIMTNYYVGYMMCLFMLIYFFYAYFSQTPRERNPRGIRFHLPRSLIVMGIFSLIAILIACLLIIPAYYSLQFGKSDFSTPSFTFTSKFDLLDIFTMLLFNSYDTVRLEGHPILYCGVLSLLLIPFYFASGRIRVRERLASAVAVFVLLLCFSIQYLDLIWHGFQAPNWLNYRYSFVLIFLLCVMAAKAFERMRSFAPKRIAAVTAVLILLVLLVHSFSYRNLDDFAGVYPNIALLVLYAVILWLLTTTRGRRKQIVKALLAVLVSVELFVAALLNLVGLDMDVVVSSYDSYHDSINTWQSAVDAVEDMDPSVYRMEMLTHLRINDPHALGFYGLSGSTSTLNQKTIDFLGRVGVVAQAHWTAYCTSNPVSDSLLGVKYVLAYLADTQRFSQLYEEAYRDEAVVAYRNPYSLPLAFTVDPSINSITFAEPEKNEYGEVTDDRAYYSNFSPMARLNVMIRHMLGASEEFNLFAPLPNQNNLLNIKYENLTIGGAGSRGEYKVYYVKDKSALSSITYTLKGDGEHEVYAFLPTGYMYDSTCSYYINGEFKGWLFTGSTHGYVNLGVIPEGEELEFKIVLQCERLYVYSGDDLYYFYYFLDDAFVSAFESLSTGGITLEEFTEDSMKGHLTASAGRTTVLTTIPYDKGWQVEVDGKPVQTYETLDALLAFDVSEGEHQIAMRYMPDEYVLGFRLCMLGCGALLLISGAEFVYRRIRAQEKKRLSACEEEKES